MVNFELIVSGYDMARNRLGAAHRLAESEGDALQLFIPLLETLGWADVIEEWLQEKYGKDWMKKLPSSSVKSKEVVLGFRYARNVVHHRWTIAVELDEEPGMLKDWRWKKNLLSTKPQPNNKSAYECRLAGRTLRHTFKDLHLLYREAQTHLLGH